MAGPVEVEVHLLSALGGVLSFRTISAPCESQDPTLVATALARLDRNAGAVLHSTSWRHRDGVVVLTYLALPDPEPRRAERLVPADGPIRSGDATRPGPSDLGVAHVVAHGCGHLALLRTTDPAIAVAANAEPSLWRLIEEHTPAVAGLITDGARSPATASGRR